MADISIVNGVYKPTYNRGAPSCSHQPSGSFIISLVPLEPNCTVISENKMVDGTFQFQVWGQNPGCPNEHQNEWRIYVHLPINRF